MESVQVNLAQRWYIGYDLDEAVPHHRALSPIRDRYGLEIFQAFFEEIVERCVAAGLVWGQELYFDGPKCGPMPAWTSVGRGLSGKLSSIYGRWRLRCHPNPQPCGETQSGGEVQRSTPARPPHPYDPGASGR